jgi:SagB-type dehydrogenase family enzyme
MTVINELSNYFTFFWMIFSFSFIVALTGASPGSLPSRVYHFHFKRKKMTIFEYHTATKHHYHKSAKSTGYLDWANQPDPFRRYECQPPIYLSLLEKDPEAEYRDLYMRGNNSEKPFVMKNVAGFLELSLGLSAWKGVPGSRWSLRINPSSGNLHPTEAHLILPEINGINPGVYHYNAFLHALEPRAVLSLDLCNKITSYFQTPGFIIGMSSIYWRESWKYGERAFRYCNHDAGHALACLSFSANLFGWKVIYLNAISDDDIKTMLGFDKTKWPYMEEEHPDFLCYVYPSSYRLVSRNLPEEILSEFSQIEFFGTPNFLSPDHFNWEIIKLAGKETKKNKTEPFELSLDDSIPFFMDIPSGFSASQIIRKRRSATGFDPSGFITQEQFMAILDKTIPRKNTAPFDVELAPAHVHLLLFVHNVVGLAQGLYFFFRNEEDRNIIRSLSHAEFLWQPVVERLPLYFLKDGNFRQIAAKVSCYQDIAGDSIFSLGMIANFLDPIERNPHNYRNLFWETGMIGQTLYLEAESYGFRGTGIGCFFDDAVHEILGFSDNRFQSLYHFTVGKHIEDRRIKTLPPYYHIERQRGN